MKRVILNVTCDFDKVPNVENLLPQELERGNQLKAEGILEHLFMKDDRMGGILVFKNVDLDGAKEIAKTFPMLEFFDIDYITVEKEY